MYLLPRLNIIHTNIKKSLVCPSTHMSLMYTHNTDQKNHNMRNIQKIHQNSLIHVKLG